MCWASAKRMWFSTSESVWRFRRSRSESGGDVRGDGDTDIHVAVEADAVGTQEGRRLPTSAGGGLADGVSERPRPASGSCAAVQQQRVRPDVALGMKIRRLLDAFQAGDFGKDFGEEAGFIEQFEARRAWPSVSILVSSSRTRSRLTALISGARRRMAAAVTGSMWKPKRAAKRTARNMRR